MTEVEVRIGKDCTLPLSVLATAKIAGFSVTVLPVLRPGCPPVIFLPKRMMVYGTSSVLRYFSRFGTARNLYERESDDETRLIYEWLEDVDTLFSGPKYEGACKNVDGDLVQRTFLVGDCLSLADIAVWSYLAGAGKRWECLLKSKEYQNLARWYNMISTQYALDELIPTYSEKTEPISFKTTEKEQHHDKQAATQSREGEASKPPKVDLLDAEMGKAKLDEDRDSVDMLSTRAKEEVAVKTYILHLDSERCGPLLST